MDEFFVKCPACLTKQRHIVLRFKEKNLAIVKCSKCGCLHHAKPEANESGVMLMISKGGIVHKAFKKFPVAKKLKKGDVVEYRKTRYELRSVEDKDGQHHEELEASEARNVYLVPFTKKIAISIHEPGGATKSYKIEESKDAVVKVGDKIKIEKRSIEITRISSLSGDVKKAKVADILALTGKV